MKNKIIQKALIILLLVIQILQITGSLFGTVQANIQNGDKIKLEGDHECDSLLEYWMEDYQKWSYKIIWYVYYLDKDDGQKYPAFCVQPARKGVGTGYENYDGTVTKFGDDRVWRVLNKGYMGSTYKEWNLECDDDLYSATKVALHSIAEGIAPKDKYILGTRSVDGNTVEEIRRRGEKVLNVAQSLYEYGLNGQEVYTLPFVNAIRKGEHKEEVIENNLYYTQEYQVIGNKSLKSYEVEISDFPSGTKILDSKNKEQSLLTSSYFKIAIPINNIKNNISGKINIKNAYIKTNPVYYCESSIESAQNYVTYTSGYETASTTVTLNVDANTSSLKIVKIDAQTKDPVTNVTFQIKSKSGQVLAKVTTNESGQAFIHKINPQNVIIEEIEVPKNYVLSKEKKEVSLKWGEQTVVEFENEKKKGSLRIVKIDKDNNEIVIPGVIFRIYDEKWRTVRDEVTDEKGEIYIEEISVGDYTIREIESRGNYKLAEDEKIEIKENETCTIKIENEKRKGRIEILKISEDDNKINGKPKGTPIKDVVFELIKDNGETVGIYQTNEEGIATTEELEIGEYTIKEIKTDKDYILNEKEYVVLVSEGMVAKITITNKSKEPPKPTLPRTGF